MAASDQPMPGTTADGETMSRSQVIADFKSGAYQLDSANIRGLSLHFS
jgi:hypothetical protein